MSLPPPYYRERPVSKWYVDKKPEVSNKYTTQNRKYKMLKVSPPHPTITTAPVFVIQFIHFNTSMNFTKHIILIYTKKEYLVSDAKFHRFTKVKQ